MTNNKILGIISIIIIGISIILNLFLYWIAPFPWKNKQLLTKASPNNDYEIQVIEKYTIDPPNQIIYLRSLYNNSRLMLVHLEEDRDNVESIMWESHDTVQIITTKYSFEYSIRKSTLIRQIK